MRDWYVNSQSFRFAHCPLNPPPRFRRRLLAVHKCYRKKRFVKKTNASFDDIVGRIKGPAAKMYTHFYKKRVLRRIYSLEAWGGSRLNLTK
jgi:hypothetical protein